MHRKPGADELLLGRPRERAQKGRKPSGTAVDPKEPAGIAIGLRPNGFRRFGWPLPKPDSAPRLLDTEEVRGSDHF